MIDDGRRTRLDGLAPRASRVSLAHERSGGFPGPRLNSLCILLFTRCLCLHLCSWQSAVSKTGREARRAASVMSLIIPDWVTHLSTDNDDKDKKKPTCIFSIHVHPDGSRLATGGIGK